MEPSQPAQPDPGTPRERDLINAAIDAAQPRSDTPDDPSALPSPGTFEGYDLLREIHRGGQGVVYLAIQRATKRRVAIKVLHGGPFGSATMRSRFEREVQVLGQLDHPNIVGIHDSGHTADGSFYYVMDYISGKPLDEFIAREPRPAIADTLKLFLKICDAVNAAHLRGVIHRDLKPSNVRVRPDGEPVVVDFGLAKTAGNEIIEGETPQLMSVTGQFIGSLPWASPEQAEGIPSKIDTRTDVYSLGVILYQLLTGKFPYSVVGHMREVLENILRAEPAKPSTVRRQINDEVETIVLKCLAKERERRYQTAGELARDIRHYMDGEPIEAKRDSGWYVISKTLRRYRAQAAFGSAMLAMIVVFGIVMSVLFSRASAAEKKATLALENEKIALAAAEQARKAESQEKDRARRNFLAGHRMAMTFIRDLHDRIKNLRGATAARDMLATAALGYLDPLSTEVGDDPALRRDLADAYDAAANMRGGLSRKVLAEFRATTELFAKSRELREQNLRDLPSDPRSHADIAVSLRNAAGLDIQSQKYEDAADLYRRAIAAGERAQSLLPPPAARAGEQPAIARAVEDGLASAHWGLGHALRRMVDRDPSAAAAGALWREAQDHFARAEAHWRERLAADPNDLESHRAWLSQRGDLVGMDKTRALGLWTRADRLAAEGRAEEAVGAFEEALRAYHAALPGAQALAEESHALARAHPDHLPTKRDVFVHEQRAGEMHEYIAKSHERVSEIGPHDRSAEARRARLLALESFGRALAVTSALAAEDHANREADRDRAICLAGVARQQARLGASAEALTNVTTALELRRALFQSDPIPRNERDAATSAYFAAQVFNEVADRETDPELRRAHYTRALAHLDESTNLFNSRIAAGGDGAADLEFVRRLAEQVRQSLASLPSGPPK